MNAPDRSIGTWILYSAIYVCAFSGLFLSSGIDVVKWEGRTSVTTLASVTTGAIGIALYAALCWEIGRYTMVIFYPMLKRQLMEQGREEGREEGRREVWEAWAAWNLRREEAAARDEPFDEPPPPRDQTSRGKTG